MQTNQPHKTPAPHAHPKAPPPKPSAAPKLSPRTRLLLIVGGSIVGIALLALIAVNLLVSADWVRDRVASRIKEQSGRVLEVKGTTALLFVPSPRVVITDATFVDPEARAGTADFSVGRLVLDLSLMELLSRQVDAKRVVLERPVLTVRLGEDNRPKADKPKSPNAAKPPSDKPRRDVRLRDVRIEDGTVNIVYDDKGTGEARACPRYAGHRRPLRRQRRDKAGLLGRGRALRQGPFDSLAARLDAREADRRGGYRRRRAREPRRLEAGRDHLQQCAFRA
jgi:hypothetical protein